MRLHKTILMRTECLLKK